MIRRVRDRATIGCVLLFSIGGLGLLATQSASIAATPPNTEPLLTQAARAIGIRRCLPAIAAVSQRGTAGATLQDIVVDWDRQSPDVGPVFSMTAIGAGTQRALLSITAFPQALGGCSILVERISTVPQSCATVASRELPQFPATQLIDGVTVYQSPKQPGETYTLVASGTGCMIVRRQASFKWVVRQ